MGISEQFSPGELVRARGREWVVVDASNALTLRPLSGSESDQVAIETFPADEASQSWDSSSPAGYKRKID